MANKKYINVKDVVELTGHSLEDIRKLASTGDLPAHKTRRGHWRLNVDAVEKYFGIQINNPKEMYDKQNTPSETRLIIENHYQEVIERIRAAKSSIKIMTGDFKRFKLKPTAKQGKNYNDGTPLIKYLMEKAEQGKSVQIICSKPSFPFLTEFGEVYKRMNPKRFDIRFCLRNHAKVIIIDDKLAYVGSANITRAGQGQGVLSPGNFEAGIITENPEYISSLKAHFSEIIRGGYCKSCHLADKCQEKINYYKANFLKDIK